MFEIVAIVTMLQGTEPKLELTLNHPFNSVEQCEEYKNGDYFRPIKKQLEDGSMFPNVTKEKFATYKFEYKCEEQQAKELGDPRK